MATAFDESTLDERIATATVDAYRCYRKLHRTSVDEWTATHGDLFQTIATAEVSLSELSPDLDTVIISGYHEFRPVERAVIARIVDAFDTIAILPLHQHGDSGADAVTADGLAVYETLEFNREAIEPQQGTPGAIEAVTNALYRHDPGVVSLPNMLRWRELPTPEREVRFVARELRAELAAGRDPATSTQRDIFFSTGNMQ